MGHPKTAKYLALGYTAVVLLLLLIMLFDDQLFSEDQAKRMVEDQDILLKDDFDVIENESTSGIGEYYHTFTLRISTRDKEAAIATIKSADNFKMDDGKMGDPSDYYGINPYFGKAIRQNYETADAYVRECFVPSGQKGYAPTFRKIMIRKNKSELIFEDIDD